LHSSYESEQAAHVRQLLKQADTLVKKHHFDDALRLVKEARSVDSKNPYASAYEERIYQLIAAHSANSPGNGSPDKKPEKAKDPSVQQKEGSAKSVLGARIAGMIERAREFENEKDFERARAEIARALLLDPKNTSLTADEQRLACIVVQESEKKSDRQDDQRAEIEQKRQELRNHHSEPASKEQEARYAQEMQTRKDIMLQKIAEYLQRAEEFVEQHQLDEALHEVRFILMVDPTNDRALAIKNEVATLLRARKEQKDEEQKKKAHAIRATVQKHIAQASELASRKMYSHALSMLTRGYIIDPANEELQACELKIRSQEDEYVQQVKQQRLYEEEERARARKEELQRLNEEEHRLQLAKLEEEDKLRAEQSERQLQHHLEKARSAMALGAFDDALAEVALAFQVNPMDDQVKKLEEEILAANEQGRQGEEASTPLELDQLLSSAHEHRNRGEFEKALDDIARAFVLDPLNEELTSLEDEVQQEWFQTQTGSSNEHAAIELKTNESSIAQKIRELLAENKTEDAIVAIALGLLEEPENKELEILKEEMLNSQSPDDRPSDRLGGLETHLSAARSFQNEGDVRNALDEVAKALSIDPMNEEAYALDKDLHESLKIKRSTIRENK